MVADELTQEQFCAPAPPLEQYHYGWSVLGCLPAVMGDPHTAATGTVMRPATLQRYAADAGFTRVEVVPVQTQEFRFYLLS